MSESLVVNEIYLSLQGESTFAGLPCVFIRLTACNLRCSYCDTAYAFTEGKRRSLEDIMTEVERLAESYQRPAASGQRLPLVDGRGAVASAQLAPADAATLRRGLHRIA